MNKKGNYADITEYIMVVLVLAIIIPFVALIVGQFNEKVQDDPTTFDNATRLASQNFEDVTTNYWDVFFALLLFAFVSFSIVMARFIPSSPKLILYSILALIILPFSAMFIENIWDKWNTGIIETMTLQMNFLPFIMNHLTLVILIYVTLVAISFLTKGEESLQGEQGL